MMNENAISNILLDVDFLEDELKRISRGHLVAVFAELRAVHFVVYGALGRGVSSSVRLDSLGKGFAEWLRAVHAPVPTRFLDKVAQGRAQAGEVVGARMGCSHWRARRDDCRAQRLRGCSTRTC